MAFKFKYSPGFFRSLLVKVTGPGEQETPISVQNDAGTSKFSVSSAGNVVASGTLAVTGASTLTGNTAVTGTLAVTGASTLTGNVTASGTLGVTGAITPTGGLAPISAGSVFFWADSGSVVTAATGTDTAGIANQLWYTQVVIPYSTTITGLGFLIGSVGGTDKAVLSVYNVAGTLLGNTTVAGGGTTVGTAANWQAIDLTAPIAVLGPTKLIVGVNTNGNNAKIRTHAGPGLKLVGALVVQTTATPATITPAATFTASTAPFMFVY